MDDAAEAILSFRRGGGFHCVVNFAAEARTMPSGRVLLASEPLVAQRLPGNSSVWLLG